jgi:KDO2-lipid IV(A) lauroyltransferase
MGRLLGRVLFRCWRRRCALALDNLAHAFPDLSPVEREKIAQRSFSEMACTFSDAISSARFDAVGICSRLQLQGWEQLGRAEETGKGVIIMSAHLGAWEIIGPITALYKGPMSVVGRPLDNPLLDRFVARNRTRFGNALVGKKGAARATLRALKGGGRAAILIDQRVQPKEGVSIPFFGRPASTSSLVARLSLKTEAPVVPIFAFAEPQGRYTVKVLQPIFPDSSSKNPVYDLTRHYMQILEEVIREDPGQWLWMHDRWKSV